MRHINNLALLVDDHFIAPLTGRPSPSQFWYAPTRVTLADRVALQSYLASPNPPYTIDYSSRTAYRLLHESGAVLLRYGYGIGDQINPEASFQAALGWHTRHLAGDAAAGERFLSIAASFLERQSDQGDFNYDFDWFESEAPWTSALAQARGASVMLRAKLMTSDQRYETAATLALSRFRQPAAYGGYMITFEDGALFFEEYPKRAAFTFNGFLVTLMGLFEVAHFLKNEQAAGLLSAGLDTLERHGERFFTSWWSLYDLDRAGGLTNVHSPMYHRMICEYLQVLTLLSDRPRIGALLERAQAMDRIGSRTMATIFKLVRKAHVR